MVYPTEDADELIAQLFEKAKAHHKQRQKNPFKHDKSGFSLSYRDQEDS
jgi:hypothetical protein